MRVAGEPVLDEADRRRLDRAGAEAVVDETAQVRRAASPGRAWSDRCRLAWLRRRRRPAAARRRPACRRRRSAGPAPTAPAPSTTRSRSCRWCRWSRPRPGARLGAEAGVGHRRRPRPSGPASDATRASSKPKASTPSASTRQAAGARGQGGRHEGAAVGGVAGPGDEGVTRLHLAAVGAQRAGARARGRASAAAASARSGQRLRPGQKLLHSAARTARWPTICGLTSMSGAHAQHAQRLLHDLAEHRRGHLAAEVDALAAARRPSPRRRCAARRWAPGRRTRRGTCWSRSSCLPACARCRSCRPPSSRWPAPCGAVPPGLRPGCSISRTCVRGLAATARAGRRPAASCVRMETGISSPSRANTV